MKVRSKGDKWLIMRKRNTEWLESIMDDAHRQLNSTDPDDWGVWSSIYVVVVTFVAVIAFDCVFEIVSDMLW